MRRLAFTLIELLTVIAITAVLLTLIVLPMIQSFNLSRQAQAFAEAQDRARRLGEQIAREIGVSAGVRDNAGTKGVVAVDPLQGAVDPATHVSTTESFLPYAKLDIAAAAQGEPAVPAGSGFTDPISGKTDPTLHAPKGQVVLPVAPGGTIVRYWIGLRDPASAYNNPYNNILLTSTGGRDNLYVLWRAEVQPMVYSATQHKFVVNKAFFYDLSRVKNPPLTPAPGKHWLPSLYRYAAGTTGPAYDYPAFFDPNDVTYTYDPGLLDPDGTADPSQEDMVKHWKDRGTIVTDINRSDMIQPVFDRRTQQVLFDGTVPKLIPLVQFKPTRISSEPATGQVAIRQSEETDSAASLAPDVYRTQYGEWSNALVRTYPYIWDGDSAATPTNPQYLVSRPRVDPATGAELGRSIYLFDPRPTSSGGDGPDAETTGGKELFDQSRYSQPIKYPFSQAVTAADARSGWLSSSTAVGDFIPYFIDSLAGRILASIGIEEVGDPSLTPPSDNTKPDYDPNNLPQAFITEAISPLEVDPNPTPAVWSPKDPAALPNDPTTNPNVYDINRAFNRAWNDPVGMTLRPDLQRFIDLRVTSQGDGTKSPLDPTGPFAVSGSTRVQIVPGSEQVFGPDQRPGPNYGTKILYSRVTRNPGPNQYRINYTDQPEPTDYPGMLGVPAPPATYDPLNFTSAVIQPRYKAGYVQFNSDPTQPLPMTNSTTAGTFQIYYRFQFTHKDDVFAVDYDSRQIMSVLLTVKNFPQQGIGTAQNVTIPVTAKVRNFIR